VGEPAARIRQTWDGQPISETPPFGATAVVFRRTVGVLTFLLLHRAHHSPEYTGDWAWGPPSGARLPAESVEACATRELLEETGLRLTLHQTDAGSSDWAVFVAEATSGDDVSLSPEHDRHVWLPLDEAMIRMAPPLVRDQLSRAARFVASRLTA
jgi:8-oxo-dGTP pyrophosphatase MutT (NUDIX family)